MGLQIHQLNNYAGPLTGSVFLPLDNGVDTGKISFMDLFRQNSFTTLWEGAVSAANTAISLSDEINYYDFIDIYYGYKGINSDYQIEYRRVPTADFANVVKIDMMYDLGQDASFRNIYHYVTELTKKDDDEITISKINAWTWSGSDSASATTTNTTNLNIYRIDGIKTPGNADGLVLNKTVTVEAANWNGSSNTVTVEDVTANSSVLVCPIPSDQTSALGFGVYCSGQGADELTFTCVTTPTVDIQYNVMVVG